MKKPPLLYYDFPKTFLGNTIVAQTSKGICFIAFGKNYTELLSMLIRYALKRGFDSQQIQRIPISFSSEYQEWFNYPVDLQGTAFQIKVWEALKNIPFGEVRSYSDIAQAIRKPKAVRAVANACGQNPISIIIPCHRVIAKSGGLGGYGSGLQYKRQLLTLEGYL